MEKQRQDRELQEIKDELLVAKEDLNREREIVSSLQDTVEQHANAKTQLEAQNQALRAQIISLQSEGESQLDNRARLNEDLEKALKRVEEVELELRAAETLRRKLHNQLQELKGNIRVFCRVRPALAQEKDIGDGLANINFPDLSEHKEIVLSSSTETATGASRDNIMPFTFDRVFGPKSTQLDVFEEISYLAQSCIDGYNVCIFAYGQTGSGKSFTMEGGPNENDSGMIPRAVKHIFQVTQDLKRKGWEYKMEGQFLEIYNETIVDLLGKGNNTKHEIKHDKDGRTTVTNVVIFPLHSPNQVQNLLSLAQSRRTVHATLMNDRSSRSHSVFTLRITGSNVDTGEKCEGSLNLVDLAGSERLKESGALNHKDRLKETQAINKSEY
ncbi:kinesin-like nuclear fusion protein [Tulasnella sp. 419]|nr:kinesin-like nuclear fusion protein [Tulasnella sp. 419]